MRVGIVGFRASGKSTVFDLLTGLGAGGRKKSSKLRAGVIKVPDHRLEKLAGILNLEKKTQLEITLVDFAPGKGERALNPKTFKQLREVDALAHVVRCFSDALDPAPPSPITVIRDFESELKLTDTVEVENRLTQLKKENCPDRDTDLLARCKAHLEGEKPLRDFSLSEEEDRELVEFGFLSRKPVLVVLNLGPNEAQKPLPKDLMHYLKKESLLAVPLSGEEELELTALEEIENLQRLKDMGQNEPASERFVHSYYRLMDLTSFLTYDEKEVRARTIKKGTPALYAMAELHAEAGQELSGIEVVRYSDLVKYGSEAKCREAGKLRSPGKEYIVQERDIVLSKFSENE